ncbi:MAG: hypothetical protein ABI221_01520 [Candidatus Saccharimonadales bacterium]
MNIQNSDFAITTAPELRDLALAYLPEAALRDMIGVEAIYSIGSLATLSIDFTPHPDEPDEGLILTHTTRTLMDGEVDPETLLPTGVHTTATVRRCDIDPSTAQIGFYSVENGEMKEGDLFIPDVLFGRDRAQRLLGLVLPRTEDDRAIAQMNEMELQTFNQKALDVFLSAFAKFK